MEVDIRGIAYDSRKVEAGSLFVAIPGFREEGFRFVEDAIQRGAIAIVAEQEPEQDIAWIQVPDARWALSALSSSFYGEPSTQLCLIGITGTNGKTTTAYLLESIFREAGEEVGLLGTVEYRYARRSEPAERTTPESLDLHQLFSRMIDKGVTHLVMEVSSHAVALHRVSHCSFDAVVFTNLTQDHLDFHKSMESYFEAKKRLFTDILSGSSKSRRFAILNADDPWSKRIAAETEGRIVTYGVENREADFSLRPIRIDQKGIVAEVSSPQGDFRVESKLLGRYNLYNIASAIATAQSLGCDRASIVQGITATAVVPGRLEPIPNTKGITVIVDYAHTPDALEKTIGAVKEFQKGRLITVFGCGGDRDREKRPQMGRIAALRSDLTIVTSDNPRGEEPQKIIEEVLPGLERGRASRIAREDLQRVNASRCYAVIVDRREAIREAIEAATPGDVVLIAGKGHETYQMIGDRREHFDDREEAQRVLAD